MIVIYGSRGVVSRQAKILKLKLALKVEKNKELRFNSMHRNLVSVDRILLNEVTLYKKIIVLHKISKKMQPSHVYYAAPICT